MDEAIRVVTIDRKEAGVVYLLWVNGNRVALDSFSDAEKARAEQLERQVWSLKPGEHHELRESIRQQAFELIVGSAMRANPDDSEIRANLERLVTPANFAKVWAAVRQTAARSGT